MSPIVRRTGRLIAIAIVAITVSPSSASAQSKRADNTDTPSVARTTDRPDRVATKKSETLQHARRGFELDRPIPVEEAGLGLSPGMTRTLGAIPHKADGSSDFNFMQPLPTDGQTVHSNPALLTLDNGDVLIAYHDWGITNREILGPMEEVSKVWLRRSEDGGNTWGDPTLIAQASSNQLGWGAGYRLSLVKSEAGRILLYRDDWESQHYIYHR